MTSPSSALIWEIWRKNRWGFVLLLVLLAAGASVALYAIGLRQRVNEFEKSLLDTQGDVIPGSAVLAPTNATPRASAQPPTPTRSAYTMDPRMLARYGLVPPPSATNPAPTSATPSEPSQPPTPARSAYTMDPRMLARYGLLPRDSATRPEAETLKPQVVRFSFGTNIIYDGVIQPKDVLAYAGLPGREGIVRFTLNGRRLFEGPLKAGAGHALGDSPSLPTTAPEVAVTTPPVAAEQTKPSRDTDLSPNSASALAFGGIRFRAPQDLGGTSTLTWTRADGQQDSRQVTLRREYSPELGELASAASNWHDWASAWGGVLLGASFLILCSIFAGAEPHPARGFTGIPTRRFTLPVSTTHLVGQPMGLGVLTLLVLSLGWALLVFHPLVLTGSFDNSQGGLVEFYLHPHSVQTELSQFACMGALLVAGLILFQALVWSLPSFPKLRAWLLAILVVAMLACAGELMGGWNATPTRTELVNGATCLFLILAGAGVWGALFGVRLERRGHWASRRSWELEMPVPAVLRPPGRGFTSALQAQFWLEWRRNARIPLYVWAGVMGLLICVEAGDLLANSTMKTFKEGILPVCMLLIPGWIAVMGLNLARDPGSRQLALSPFTATRPVGTETLLLAKVMVGALLWLLTAISLAVASALSQNELPPATGVIEKVFVLAALFHVFVGILPLCLSGRIPGFPWSLMPLILIYGVLLNAIFWLDRHQDLFPEFFVVLILLVAAKFALGYWGFRRSLRLRLISPGFVVGYLGLWIGMVACLASWSWWWLQGMESYAREPWGLVPTAVSLALLVVPLARIALSPLALAMNRHR